MWAVPGDGVAAAPAAGAGVSPRRVDVRAVQAKLRELGMDLNLLRRLGPSPEGLGEPGVLTVSHSEIEDTWAIGETRGFACAPV